MADFTVLNAVTNDNESSAQAVASGLVTVKVSVGGGGDNSNVPKVRIIAEDQPAFVIEGPPYIRTFGCGKVDIKAQGINVEADYPLTVSIHDSA